MPGRLQQPVVADRGYCYSISQGPDRPRELGSATGNNVTLISFGPGSTQAKQMEMCGGPTAVLQDEKVTLLMNNECRL